jgi:hypothetical protein
MAPNHKILTKDVACLTKYDVDDIPLDLIFFDCHTMSQMTMYDNFLQSGIITNDTIIALHDTNLHYPYPSFQPGGVYIEKENGYAHQPVERKMVNIFKTLGYDIFSISTNITKHDNSFPFRHGVTICKKFKRLL